MMVPSFYYILVAAVTTPAFATIDVENGDTWKTLAAVFGSQLHSSFGHPSTLHHATSASHLSLDQDGYRVFCASYVKGQRIAEQLRASSDVITIQPLLVDRDIDAVCFASNQPIREAGLEGDININFLVPSPLKIHHSVYDIVTNLLSGSPIMLSNPVMVKMDTRLLDDLSPSNKTHPGHHELPKREHGGSPDDISVVFHPGSIDQEKLPKREHGDSPDDISVIFHPGSDDQKDLVDHFRTSMSNLGMYDFSSLSDNFWTKPSTSDYFSEAMKASVHSSATKLTDVEPFSDRATSWTSLMSYLQTRVETETQAGIMSDPCLLNSYPSLQKEDSVSFPIKHFANSDDPKLSAACLVYIASSLSQLPASRLIALTNRPVLFNYRSRSIQQSATVGSSSSTNPYAAQGLLGTGQIGAIADTGLDVSSCYFSESSGYRAPVSSVYSSTFSLSARKVVMYAYEPNYGDTNDMVGGHGTHTAGTMAGSAQTGDYTQNIYSGVAPNAKIAFIDVSKNGQGLVGLSSNVLFTPGYNAGARVHTNSWGSFFSGNGFYAAQDVDTFLYKHTDMIIFYAAGNAGEDRTTSMESSSKNAVAVGASESTFDSENIAYVAYYSSKGPTYDGRFKPDLVAPGDSIMSVMSNGASGPTCTTTEKTGTSMASPGAAGTALLVRQYFIDSTSVFWRALCNKTYSFCRSFTPSGVLVKATLLHSGSAMTRFNGGACGCNLPTQSLGAPPDSTQGFGRITLSNVLPLAGKYFFDLFVEDLTVLLPNKAVYYHTYVSSSSRPLKVTVSWYDPPAQQGSTGKALINDLNLLVKGDDGSIYRGNGGNGAGGFDSLNTNEQVYIASPKVQRYEISVSAGALLTASQAYSIVITCAGKSGP